MNEQIISIVGLPGVGKTTSLSIIRENNPDWLIIDEMFINMINKIRYLHRQAEYENKYKDIQKLYLDTAIKKINSIVCKNKNLLIFDRGIVDTWLMTEFYGEKGLLDINYFNAEYYYKIINFFPKLTIFLDADTKTIIQRKIIRDSDNGKNKRPRDDKFNEQVTEYYKKWYLETNCKFIKTDDLSPKNVAYHIKYIIEEWRNGNMG